MSTFRVDPDALLTTAVRLSGLRDQLTEHAGTLHPGGIAMNGLVSEELAEFLRVSSGAVETVKGNVDRASTALRTAATYYQQADDEIRRATGQGG